MKLDIKIVKENVVLVDRSVTTDELPEIVETMLKNVHKVEITITRKDWHCIRKENNITREDAKNKAVEVAENFFRQVKSKIDSALNSGSVDLESYENNYILPRMIVEAAVKDVYERNLPPTKEWRKEVENIYRCL